MKDEEFDRLLERLVSSTRSPRGRFSANESWRLLQQRMHRRRWLPLPRYARFPRVPRLSAIASSRFRRFAGAAAVALLCLTSWAAYHAYRQVQAARTEAVIKTEEPHVPQRLQETLAFRQETLEEIARQLSETFGKKIYISDDSLKAYRMTATFYEGESLAEILELLKEAGGFSYTQTNDTINLIH